MYFTVMIVLGVKVVPGGVKAIEPKLGWYWMFYVPKLKGRGAEIAPLAALTCTR